MSIRESFISDLAAAIFTEFYSESMGHVKEYVNSHPEYHEYWHVTLTTHYAQIMLWEEAKSKYRKYFRLSKTQKKMLLDMYQYNPYIDLSKHGGYTCVMPVNSIVKGYPQTAKSLVSLGLFEYFFKKDMMSGMPTMQKMYNYDTYRLSPAGLKLSQRFIQEISNA